MKIRTDNRWKQFKYRDEVPKKVLDNQFDWTKEGYEKDGDYSDGFFKHHNTWYHLADFERAPGELKDLGWDGYHTDSFSTGVVIKVSSDGEEYKVGYYTT